MKKYRIILFAFLVSLSGITFAQVQEVMLTQTKGAFTTESLTLAPGQYQFKIANENVPQDVGFVLVPKGKYDATDHIKEAYVKEMVSTGSSSMSSVVDLAPGEYEYFCPMNPTPKYTLKVMDKKMDVETIRLGQTPSEFTIKGLTVDAGSYQFDIANDGVENPVGFVLVPKGKYDAMDHIRLLT